MDAGNPLARYLLPLRRWWFVVAGVLVLALAGAWATLPAPEAGPSAEEIADPTVEFRATHVLIRDRLTASTESFALVLLLARQGELTNRIDERMGDAVDVEDIEAVQLEPDDEIGTLSITAVQPTPDAAVELVTIFAEELTAFFDERADTALQEQVDGFVSRLTAFDARIRSLEQEVEGLPEESLDRRLLESELNVLIEQFGLQQTELRDLTSVQATATSTFESLQDPVPVSSAAGGQQIFEVPNNSLARFVLAGFAALILGAALVFAVDYVDTRIRTRQDAEAAFGLPVIAEIPRVSRTESKDALVVQSEPSSATAEAFRALRLSVLLNARWRLDRQAPTTAGSVGSAAPVVGQREPKTLLVTSTLTGEGKSTVVANLAASLAESGQQVLVVDCDFRRSTAGKLLGVEAASGMREVRDPSEARLADLAVPTSIPGVRLIPSGSLGLAPPWFLSGSAALVAASVRLADIVLFDTGPLLITNEATALIPSIDAVLLVNWVGKVSKERARATTEQLARVSADVAGIVLVAGEGGRRYAYYEAPRAAAAQG